MTSARRLSRLPLRVRLTAGFSAAMLFVLAAAGGFVYWRVQFALDRNLDAELTQAAATIAPLVATDGRLDARARRAALATGSTWQVVDAQGDLRAGSPTAPDTPIVPASRRPAGATALVDVGGFLPVAAQPYRVLVEPVGQATLLVALRRDRRDEALRELLLQLLLAGLGALVVTAMVGDRLARAALRPVEDYRRRAAAIASGASGLRLEVPAVRDDEVTRLGHTLNDMLAAQEHALERERRFVQEASHELRTPLTLLRGRIQLARRRERRREELEETLDELLVDVARLSDLADHLLEVGLLDGEVAATNGLGCDPVEVVRAVVDRLRATSPAAPDVLLTADVRGERAVPGVALPAGELERAVTNLVANARVHGSPPVSVTVAPERAEGSWWWVLNVSDTGDGMAAALLEVATGRFTRADEARSRPGAGLGLGIVERLVARVGGQLRLCSGGLHTSHPGPGAAGHPVPCRHSTAMTATLVLPAASDAPAPDDLVEPQA